jgi:maltose alpha-D-glucosyltransferase / alpha-amylase
VNKEDNIIDPAFQVTTVGDLLAGHGLALLRKRLVTYLPHQRWFGAKSKTIKAVAVLDSAEIPGLNASLLYLQVSYQDESTDVYQLPVAVTAYEEGKKGAFDPDRLIARVSTPAGPAVLHDAVGREDVRQAILELVEQNGQLRTESGVLHGHKSTALSTLRSVDALPSGTGSAEQSNTSILYGDKFIMKLFRRLQPGQNPDTEIGRFLTETAHFIRIAPFLGDITLDLKDREPTTVAMLQGLVENDGDGWQWTLNELSHYYRHVANLPPPPSFGAYASFLSDERPPDLTREYAGSYMDAAALLGKRTAEMHLALATTTDNPAFAAEDFAHQDLYADASRIENQLILSLAALERSLSGLTGINASNAALVLSRRENLMSRTKAIASATATNFGQRIRIHGDYHLGQILHSHDDFVILDFEGEPAKPLAARRTKQSPLKDVAGMLRSFGYAAYAALHALGERAVDATTNVELWAELWQNAVSVEFLRAYRITIGATKPHLIPPPPEAQMLLDAYLLEKALYELLYELDNRHEWVRIPLAGILTLRT